MQPLTRPVLGKPGCTERCRLPAAVIGSALQDDEVLAAHVCCHDTTLESDQPVDGDLTVVRLAEDDIRVVTSRDEFHALARDHPGQLHPCWSRRVPRKGDGKTDGQRGPVVAWSDTMTTTTGTIFVVDMVQPTEQDEGKCSWGQPEKARHQEEESLRSALALYSLLAPLLKPQSPASEAPVSDTAAAPVAEASLSPPAVVKNRVTDREFQVALDHGMQLRATQPELLLAVFFKLSLLSRSLAGTILLWWHCRYVYQLGCLVGPGYSPGELRKMLWSLCGPPVVYPPKPVAGTPTPTLHPLLQSQASRATMARVAVASSVTMATTASTRLTEPAHTNHVLSRTERRKAAVADIRQVVQEHKVDQRQLLLESLETATDLVAGNRDHQQLAPAVLGVMLARGVLESCCFCSGAHSLQDRLDQVLQSPAMTALACRDQTSLGEKTILSLQPVLDAVACSWVDILAQKPLAAVSIPLKLGAALLARVYDFLDHAALYQTRPTMAGTCRTEPQPVLTRLRSQLPSGLLLLPALAPVLPAVRVGALVQALLEPELSYPVLSLDKAPSACRQVVETTWSILMHETRGVDLPRKPAVSAALRPRLQALAGCRQAILSALDERWVTGQLPLLTNPQLAMLLACANLASAKPAWGGLDCAFPSLEHTSPAWFAEPVQLPTASGSRVVDAVFEDAEPLVGAGLEVELCNSELVQGACRALEEARNSLLKPQPGNRDVCTARFMVTTLIKVLEAAGQANTPSAALHSPSAAGRTSSHPFNPSLRDLATALGLQIKHVPGESTQAESWVVPLGALGEAFCFQRAPDAFFRPFVSSVICNEVMGCSPPKTTHLVGECFRLALPKLQTLARRCTGHSQSVRAMAPWMAMALVKFWSTPRAGWVLEAQWTPPAEAQWLLCSVEAADTHPYRRLEEPFTEALLRSLLPTDLSAQRTESLCRLLFGTQAGSQPAAGVTGARDTHRLWLECVLADLDQGASHRGLGWGADGARILCSWTSQEAGVPVVRTTEVDPALHGAGGSLHQLIPTELSTRCPPAAEQVLCPDWARAPERERALQVALPECFPAEGPQARAVCWNLLLQCLIQRATPEPGHDPCLSNEGSAPQWLACWERKGILTRTPQSGTRRRGPASDSQGPLWLDTSRPSILNLLLGLALAQETNLAVDHDGGADVTDLTAGGGSARVAAGCSASALLSGLKQSGLQTQLRTVVTDLLTTKLTECTPGDLGSLAFQTQTSVARRWVGQADTAVLGTVIPDQPEAEGGFSLLVTQTLAWNLVMVWLAQGPSRLQLGLRAGVLVPWRQQLGACARYHLLLLRTALCDWKPLLPVRTGRFRGPLLENRLRRVEQLAALLSLSPVLTVPAAQPRAMVCWQTRQLSVVSPVLTGTGLPVQLDGQECDVPTRRLLRNPLPSLLITTFEQLSRLMLTQGFSPASMVVLSLDHWLIWHWELRPRELKAATDDPRRAWRALPWRDLSKCQAAMRSADLLVHLLPDANTDQTPFPPQPSPAGGQPGFADQLTSRRHCPAAWRRYARMPPAELTACTQQRRLAAYEQETARDAVAAHLHQAHLRATHFSSVSFWGERQHWWQVDALAPVRETTHWVEVCTDPVPDPTMPWLRCAVLCSQEPPVAEGGDANDWIGTVQWTQPLSHLLTSRLTVVKAHRQGKTPQGLRQYIARCVVQSLAKLLGREAPAPELESKAMAVDTPERPCILPGWTKCHDARDVVDRVVAACAKGRSGLADLRVGLGSSPQDPLTQVLIHTDLVTPAPEHFQYATRPKHLQTRAFRNGQPQPLTAWPLTKPLSSAQVGRALASAALLPGAACLGLVGIHCPEAGGHQGTLVKPSDELCLLTDSLRAMLDEQHPGMPVKSLRRTTQKGLIDKQRRNFTRQTGLYHRLSRVLGPRTDQQSKTKKKKTKAKTQESRETGSTWMLNSVGWTRLRLRFLARFIREMNSKGIALPDAGRGDWLTQTGWNRHRASTMHAVWAEDVLVSNLLAHKVTGKHLLLQPMDNAAYAKLSPGVMRRLAPETPAPVRLGVYFSETMPAMRRGRGTGSKGSNPRARKRQATHGQLGRVHL